NLFFCMAVITSKTQLSLFSNTQLTLFSVYRFRIAIIIYIAKLISTAFASNKYRCYLAGYAFAVYFRATRVFYANSCQLYLLAVNPFDFNYHHNDALDTYNYYSYINSVYLFPGNQHFHKSGYKLFCLCRK
ncbi:hypothetical protein LCGC14_2053490, partial [marine sediment metagenome]